jgi:hypothetical protein
MPQMQTLIVACHTASCCPTVNFDSLATPDKQVVIIDDFGGESRMSQEQFKIIIEKGKNLRFQNVVPYE